MSGNASHRSAAAEYRATDRLECSTAGSATVALAALKPPTL